MGVTHGPVLRRPDFPRHNAYYGGLAAATKTFVPRLLAKQRGMISKLRYLATGTANYTLESPACDELIVYWSISRCCTQPFPLHPLRHHPHLGENNHNDRFVVTLAVGSLRPGLLIVADPATDSEPRNRRKQMSSLVNKRHRQRPINKPWVRDR